MNKKIVLCSVCVVSPPKNQSPLVFPKDRCWVWEVCQAVTTAEQAEF